MPRSSVRIPRRSFRLATGRGLAAAVALAACSAGEGAQPGGGGPGGRGGPRGPGGDRNAPVPIEIGTVSTGKLARTTMVTGALEPIRSVGVNAQTSGVLTAVLVEEGTPVRAGQVLARVDAREISAQVRAAEASLAFARSTAERSEQLFRDRVITAAEYERDKAALASAQATFDQARTRLGFSTVNAPIGGVITEKRVEAGDVAQGQARLFTIADVSTLVARVLVSELDVAGVGEGDPAEVTVDALGGARFQARVRRVFPAADTANRMVPVEVALGGSAARLLKPGFLARVTFRLGERSGVMLVPAAAVIGTPQSRAVFLVKEGKAERRPVRTGSASGDHLEVLDGLAVGDTVVVAGTDQVRDGGPVRIVQPVGVASDARRTAAVQVEAPR